MKVIQKLLVGSLFLASFAITMAQEGDRSPSFDDPFATVVFPQFVVGPVGGVFEFEVETRVGNGSDFPFAGDFFLFSDVLDPLVGVLVNGEPYTQNGIPLLLGPKESMSLLFSVPQGAGPQTTSFQAGLALAEKCATGASDPAGGAASVDDLSWAFFYILRDGDGNLIDSIAVPEARAGTTVQLVMSRRPGFDTGFAIFVTIPQPVGIRIFLPDGGPSPAGTTVLEGVNPLLEAFRDDFFPDEFVNGLPEVIDSAVVELTVEIGQIYAMAVGVRAEGLNVQLSGQNVNPILLGGAPFNDQ